MRTFQRHPPVTAAFDRGPAKYFHGRKRILSDFNELIARANLTDSGTTFLIQGAPGAGKTALLAESERLAQTSEWETTEISSAALWDPNELQQSLKLRRTWKVGGGSARVGISGIGEAEINAERSPQTIKNLLRGGKKPPLLLILDEAQTLGLKDEIPADQINTVRHVLNTIHNGKLDRPVILIAAGLGTTADAFGTLGISRFAAGAFVELGALDKEAERAVLHDWLTKDGEVRGNPIAWIDTITQETHGWPQHILSYVKPALDQLHADKGVMTAEGLSVVLEAGRIFRSEYYEHRTQGFSTKQRHSLAKIFANVPLGGRLDIEDIMMSLTQDHGSEKAKKIFHQALYKGVLYRYRGDYSIPIPSMHDWLVSNYAREQIKFPHETQTAHSLGERNSGMDFGR